AIPIQPQIIPLLRHAGRWTNQRTVVQSPLHAGGNTMSNLKQSAAWWCFVPARMTPEAFVRAAADIGYDAVELVPEEYWPLVKQHGLAIASHGGHRPLEDGLNKRENHERITREIEANLKL